MSQETFESFGEEVKARFIKWGAPSDWVKGTLIEVRSSQSQFNPGERQNNYVVKVSAGSFHDIITNPDGTKVPASEVTLLQAGDMWCIGGKQSIDDKMKDVKLGQVFAIKFTEYKPSKVKGYGPQKVMVVRKGEMDPEYEKQKDDLMDAPFN